MWPRVVEVAEENDLDQLLTGGGVDYIPEGGEVTRLLGSLCWHCPGDYDRISAFGVRKHYSVTPRELTSLLKR
jgi:hypothetical protein